MDSVIVWGFELAPLSMLPCTANSPHQIQIIDIEKQIVKMKYPFWKKNGAKIDKDTVCKNVASIHSAIICMNHSVH